MENGASDACRLKPKPKRFRAARLADADCDVVDGDMRGSRAARTAGED